MGLSAGKTNPSFISSERALPVDRGISRDDIVDVLPVRILLHLGESTSCRIIRGRGPSTGQKKPFKSLLSAWPLLRLQWPEEWPVSRGRWIFVRASLVAGQAIFFHRRFLPFLPNYWEPGDSRS